MSRDLSNRPETGFIVHSKRTVREVLRQQAERSGDKIFLSFVPTGRRYSYQEVDETTDALARRLVASGISKGDRVAIFMDNSPEMVFLIFALAKAGAVAAPLNTAGKGKLLEYYLNLADPVALFVDAHLLEQIKPAVTARNLSRVFVLGDLALADREGTSSFEELMTRPAEHELTDTHFSDLALLLFTSGTTGPSKAIMFSQAQALFWGGDIARLQEFEVADIEYVCLPLFHGNSLLNCTFGAMMAGTSIVLTDRFSVSRFWEDTRAYGVTRFLLIGAMISFLWSRPAGPADRDHQIRVVTFAPTPKYAADFMSRFGIKSLAGYGLTDFALATILRTDAPVSKLGSVGLPRDGITLKIFDDDDNELPQGSIGEIVLRSDNTWGISLGYFRNSEATVAANRNQWFHTGDNGYIDADGYVYFLDRKKDAIRRRGENISAYEVEEVLNLHPSVQQATVYAVKSELGEDEVAASVTLRPDSTATFEELVAHCAANMAYFMVPRYIEIVDSLPKTPSQKVEKFKLRERAQQDMTRFWDREAAGIVLTRRRSH